MQPQYSTPSKRFYVYTLARPDGRVFYVGKGTLRKHGHQRFEDHEREAAKGHDCYKCHIIRKTWNNGGEIIRAIVFESDEEPEALLEERRLIAAAEPGTLTNLTSGGDGFSGVEFNLNNPARLPRTPEWRAKIGDGNRGKPRTPELRQRIGARKGERR